MEFTLQSGATIKEAIVQLTRSLAVEWAPLGVRVNAVAPSHTRAAILETVGGATASLAIAEYVVTRAMERL